jgi:prevent-host-death family protein
MEQFNIHEAKTQLSKLIKKVSNGEEIIIAKGNKPVAKLIHFSQNKKVRKIGSAKGKIKIKEDFNAPVEDFKEYM